MADLAKKLNITNGEGWYNLSWTILEQHKGERLLQLYGYSTPRLLSNLCPEYIPACRATVSRITHELHLSKVEDLLQHHQYPHNMSQLLTSLTTSKHGSHSCFGSMDSLSLNVYPTLTLTVIVLECCFPELNITSPSKSKHVTGYWNDLNNQRRFLTDLALKLSILDDHSGLHRIH